MWKGEQMSAFQIAVLLCSAAILLLCLSWFFHVNKTQPIVVKIEQPIQINVCPVCFRNYNSPDILFYHLNGRNGEGQHGRIDHIRPLEIDGEACVSEWIQHPMQEQL